jgi:hypothetical protein
MRSVLPPGTGCDSFLTHERVRVSPPRRPLFIHTARRFKNPQSNSVTSRQRSTQKPPRDHFERGQRLHHLATSSTPDDLVELVPQRANVGAKAKTLPFVRSLRRAATSTNAWRLARLPFVLSTARRRPDPDEVCLSYVPHHAQRPTATGPAWTGGLRALSVIAFL